MAATVEKKRNPFEKKKETSQFNIKQDRDYEFVLTNNTEPIVYIPTRLEVWDDETGKARVLNYSPIYDSQWLDEQPEGTPIENKDRPIFQKGKLRVSGKKERLIKFLLLHDWGKQDRTKVLPKNKHNFNRFRINDPNQTIKISKERREAIAKAGKIIIDADINELRQFMKSEFSIDPYIDSKIDDPEEYLLERAYALSNSYPDKFVSDFTNPKHKIKFTVLLGFNKRLLDDMEDGVIKWADTGAEIYTYKNIKGKSEDILTAWILNGDKKATEFYTNLQTKLSEE